MTVIQILAADVRNGRLGFANAIHRLVEMSSMDLLTAKRLIHEAMNND
jgi:hypothetical protein